MPLSTTPVRGVPQRRGCQRTVLLCWWTARWGATGSFPVMRVLVRCMLWPRRRGSAGNGAASLANLASIRLSFCAFWQTLLLMARASP